MTSTWSWRAWTAGVTLLARRKSVEDETSTSSRTPLDVLPLGAIAAAVAPAVVAPAIGARDASSRVRRDGLCPQAQRGRVEALIDFSSAIDGSSAMTTGGNSASKNL